MIKVNNDKLKITKEFKKRQILKFKMQIDELKIQIEKLK